MGSEEFGSIMGADTLPENVAEMPMFNYGWDASFSGGQSGNFLGSSTMVHDHHSEYGVMLENQTPFTADSSLLVDVVPKIPSLETGNFSGDGKRKRKSVEVVKHMDHESIISNSGKQGKAADCNGEEPRKEDYVLVRAKRGQATNSHSLAERVRREKISERMKLLQDLVPGCNKISGKAVMLDEIINYVQSLQQQVEFLSMKLSTVNPDINVDIERLLSKDLQLHPQPRGGNAIIDQGLSSSHAFLPGIPRGPINGFQGATPPFHPLPSNLWNYELQSVHQMGFDSNPPPLSSLGANGLSKMEM